MCTSIIFNTTNNLFPLINNYIEMLYLEKVINGIIILLLFTDVLSTEQI